MSSVPMDGGLPLERSGMPSSVRAIEETDWAHLPLDRTRGHFAVWLTILTEGFLFVSFFFSYGYLSNNKIRWEWDVPPRLHYAIPMLIILVCSSFVMVWGERQVKRQNYLGGRLALVITIVMGLGFLFLSAMDYKEHWLHLTPTTDSYGSIFYATVSLHGAHVIVGLLILGYLLVMPRYSPSAHLPHRPYRVGAMYWHFVDVVWIFVVGILYVWPNLGNR
jgi:cytochrome c oxidase subunit 3